LILQQPVPSLLAGLTPNLTTVIHFTIIYQIHKQIFLHSTRALVSYLQGFNPLSSTNDLSSTIHTCSSSVIGLARRSTASSWKITNCSFQYASLSEINFLFHLLTFCKSVSFSSLSGILCMLIHQLHHHHFHHCITASLFHSGLILPVIQILPIIHCSYPTNRLTSGTVYFSNFLWFTQ